MTGGRGTQGGSPTGRGVRAISFLITVVRVSLLPEGSGCRIAGRLGPLATRPAYLRRAVNRFFRTTIRRLAPPSSV